MNTEVPPNDHPLADVPGGWRTQTITVGDSVLRVTLPADPDAFLDDGETVADHERTGYMPYWPYLWPAAATFAKQVAAADWPAGRRVLEIGAGVGLVGLAACAAGHRVAFSDYRPESVKLCLWNAKQNGFHNCCGLCFDWRQPPPANVDVILGCEVVYERAVHEPVLNVLEQMLAADGVCWLADPGRHTLAEFVVAARRRGFEVQFVDSVGVESRELTPGEYRRLELRRRLRRP